ncbi:MAG: PilX N-terminal domain-containing pilus assembly protein [Thiobacillus sp.]|nr:PilX N-terminal domain-containing pilus assembly protein [Thiobacillus sp.]
MMRISKPVCGRLQQTGIALITGLVFLVMLTLIAVTAMQSTTLEERMAGNARSRDLAFQAAEATVRGAEAILSGASLPAFNGSKVGYYAQLPNGGSSDYWKNTHDWAAQSVLHTGALTGVKEARFVIEALPASLGSGGDDSLVAKALSGGEVYRITTRGIGTDGTSSIFLQTTFRR